LTGGAGWPLVRGMTKRFALVVVLLTGPVQATTLVAKDLSALVDGSAVVVRARVSQLRARQVDARHWVTVAECERLEPLKGELPASFRVVTPGAVTDEVSQLVEGAARLEVGAEVVLFLTRGADDVYRVTGWEQGHWRVLRRGDGVEALVPQAPTAARVSQGQQLVAPLKPLTLAELEQQLSRAR